MEYKLWKYPSYMVTSVIYLVAAFFLMRERPLNNILSNEATYLGNEVIGQNEVAVPTHLFKVIIVENAKGVPVAMGSFIVPNEPIGYNHALKEYEVDIKELERVSGLIFTPKLDRTKLKDLCKVDGCKLMEREAFELYFIQRKLDSANTAERLEKVWAELAEKKLKPPRDMQKFYEMKKIELESSENKKMSERAKG